MKIFNELIYAENLISGSALADKKFISLGELIILAKYWRWEKELSESEIEQKIVEFCQKYILGFNDILYLGKIEDAIKFSAKNSLRIPQDVVITENELKSIRSLKNYRYEKILFTMLVLGKYYKITNTGKNKSASKTYYLGKMKTNAIFRLAHVTQKKGENILHQLYKAEKIDHSLRTDSFYLTFTNTDDSSSPAIVVTDMNRIIEFYPPYCEDCGRILVKKSKMHNKCEGCYQKYRQENLKKFKREWKQRNSKKHIKVEQSDLYL